MGLLNRNKEPDINWKQELFNTAKCTSRIEARLDEFGKDIKEQKYAAHRNKEKIEDHITVEERTFDELKNNIVLAAKTCEKAEIVDVMAEKLDQQGQKIQSLAVGQGELNGSVRFWGYILTAVAVISIILTIVIKLTG